MKKTSYILFAALSLLFASCVQESMSSTEEDNGITYIKTPPKEGDMVEVSFTAIFPDLEATTKGEMGDKPAIDNLYAAVFGGNHGKLQNWIPCKYTKAPENNGYDYRVKYTVQLPITDLHRTVHFIANPPEDQNPPEFLYESAVMDSLMYTKGTKAAYWQMKDFPNGITVETDGEGDYAFKDGAYVASQELKDSLELIALVRNYAKITVTSVDETSDDGFTIVGWELINYPTAGSIAPYNEYSQTFKTPYYWIDEYRKDDSYTSVEQIGDTSDAGASTITNNYDTGGLFHALLDYEYGGFVPYVAEYNTNKPTSLSKTSGQYAFMYERGLPLASQTAVIVQIKWNNDDKYLENYKANDYPYYKIEILDSEGEYVPIYRNLTYTLALSDIQGLGKKTLDDAYKGAYFGNVSSSLQTSLVNEITDNKSTLYVGEMDVALRDSVDYSILYWFRPQNTADKYLYTDVLKVREACSYIHYEIEEVDGYEPAIASINGVTETTTGTSDSQHTAGLLSFKTHKPDSVKIKKSYLRISGQYFENGTANVTSYRELYRKVTVTVLPKLNFSNCSITPSPVDSSANQTVTIKFSIPSDLGEAVFPLNIIIEAKDPCLSTNDTSLPVNSGTSMFDEKMKNFYFIKTINYVDYCTITAKGYEYNTDYECTFTTTIDITPTKVCLADKGDYFNKTTLDLTTTTPSSSGN